MTELLLRGEKNVRNKNRLDKDKKYTYLGSVINKQCPACKGRVYKDTKGANMCLDCGKILVVE
jgi:hypothetical protein